MYPLQFVTYVVTSASLTPRPPKIGTRPDEGYAIGMEGSQGRASGFAGDHGE